MLAQLLTQEVVVVFLVFARLGSAAILLPGLGEASVPVRVRLLAALALSVAVAQMVRPTLPAVPDMPVALLVLLGGEIAIGLFIGTIGRLLVIALAIAGEIVAFQTNLSAAQAFNPGLGQQGVLTSSFLTTLGVLLIFVTNLHHVLIAGLVDSYLVFPPSQLPPLGDVTDTVVRTGAEAFLIAAQITAPLLLIGIVFNIGLGILARLMPQLPVLFVALPAQIGIGLTVFGLTLSAGMLIFLDRFADIWTRLFAAGL
ncbi:MAG: flagellar biosynthetic protein FliR [Alphaproteobacteria bacterium]